VRCDRRWSLFAVTFVRRSRSRRCVSFPFLPFSCLLFSLLLSFTADTSSYSQTTLGYNLAALKYLQRQHEANRVAEFYEQDSTGMKDESDVRAQIEAQAKKRKRATLRS
jgi:hypothetical protein